ncbi:MAG: fructosamine kinase family protein [Gammaproteobacteria bacterium]|nr:fructosamine kinase family protein [Gammaproteobacteria bacterium]
MAIGRSGFADPDLDAEISRILGRRFRTLAASPVGGGCINDALVIESDDARYFVKFNDESRLPMFEAEADGLRELAASRTVRVPEPLCAGTTGGRAFLVLEYLDLGPASARAARTLGGQLAHMHSVKREYFGWGRDNSIGTTPQPNEPCDAWPEFFRRRRLGHQLALLDAAQSGAGALCSKGQRLCDGVDRFFSGYEVFPSLLHGDLWGGNFSALAGDEPVIFDPAVYYGDRETDIAMTELFGGFSGEFYNAYSSVSPLDAGYRVRRDLYKLYHVLNHVNLFGAGYAGQAEQLMDALLAELG